MIRSKYFRFFAHPGRSTGSVAWYLLLIGFILLGVFFILIFHSSESHRDFQERTGSSSFAIPSLKSVISTEKMPLTTISFSNFASESKESQEKRDQVKKDKRKVLSEWHHEDLRGLRKCGSSFAFGESHKEDECWNAASEYYLEKWRTGKEVSKLCELEAQSAIHCHDSPPTGMDSTNDGGSTFGKKLRPTRYCEFTNAMVNFKKMRKDRGRRSFERGFLSASCGYEAPESIGINIYYPDITEQQCDYVFNETTLVYSHANIHRATSVLRDYWTVFSMLLLADVATGREIKSISLLNIDSLVRGEATHFNEDMDDASKHFFYQYHTMFRRVMKATDFDDDSTACFRKLIWLSRPSDMHRDYLGLGRKRPSSSGSGSGRSKVTLDEDTCSLPERGSTIFHRWSLYSRKALGFLGSSDRSKVYQVTKKTMHVLFDTGEMRSSSKDTLQRYATAEDLAAAVMRRRPSWLVSVVDLPASSSIRDLMEVFSNVSLIVTGKGAESLIGAAYMPVGTRYCCGVIELTHSEGSGPLTQAQAQSSAAAKVLTSFQAHASFMGHHHKEVVMNHTARGLEAFMSAIEEMEGAMAHRPSCLHL